LGVQVVLDYLKYEQLPAGLAFGSYPDGQPEERGLFHLPSPGTTNSLATPPIQVWINEWMASNSGWLLDPDDGDPDDWFELYNGGATTADLSAYTLTDDLLNPAKFMLPNGTSIPAGGLLLVWADEETGQSTNGTLHVNFKLSNSGESLALFAPNGDRVDLTQFGPQTDNVSEGRFPDGMTEPFVFMILPSPGQPNQFATANKPPVLTPVGARSLDEGQTLQFTATATDSDAGQQLSYSLVGAPAGALINPGTGAFSWTTAEADGPGQYSFTVRVTDNGVPPRLDAETITVTVRELNNAPILDPVNDRTIEEGSALLFTATARDADLPLQALRYTLDPGAPAGAAINALTGEFTWTPAEAQGPGTYPITIRVSDDANPSASALQSFTIQVNEVDNSPVFTPIGLQAVDEGKPFGLTVLAQDPDTPARAVAYSVVTGPSGLQIDSATGLVSWTPDERQGPNSYSVEIRATEVNGTRSATQTFSIVVNEVNQAPAIVLLPDRIVDEGAEVRFLCTATDSDLPAQKLSFTLEPGAPQGATIDPNTGQFVWQLGADVGPSTNRITIRVADNAINAKSATVSFTIIVRAEPRIVINEIMYRAATVGAEYVELHNVSTNTAWSLAGWRLSGTDFTFPSGTTLSPGSYLVVARNLTVFQTSYSGTNALGNFVSQLAPDGGTVALWRPMPGGGESLVDYVTFSSQAPWPALANGGGASLQLIDARQDNTRVANWAAVSGTSTNAPRQVIGMEDSWRYWQNSGEPAAGWENRIYDDSSWPTGLALLYVESAALPATKNTQLTLGQMSYLFRTRFQFNGNTEGASLQLNTILDDGAVFYLNGQPIYWLAMTEGQQPARDTAAARTVSDAINEGPFVIPVTNLVNGQNVMAVRVHQANSGSSDIVFGAAVDVLEVRRESYTPGYANSVRATLEPFPAVYLNEVLASNTAGIRDSAGDREPWIEIINLGAETAVLDGYGLGSNFNNTRQWTFPAGASLAPGAHQLVWADGEPAESTASEWHTSFRLTVPSGVVVLSRLQGGQPVVVDSLAYTALGADQSFGFQNPDRFGQLPNVLAQPTPGSPNNSVLPPAPKLLPVACKSDGTTVLIWTTVPGRVYRAEFKDQLGDVTWQSAGELTATSSTASITDSSAVGKKQRFYRVALLPW
jgi:hypothetical protein